MSSSSSTVLEFEQRLFVPVLDSLIQKQVTSAVFRTHRSFCLLHLYSTNCLVMNRTSILWTSNKFLRYFTIIFNTLLIRILEHVIGSLRSCCVYVAEKSHLNSLHAEFCIGTTFSEYADGDLRLFLLTYSRLISLSFLSALLEQFLFPSDPRSCLVF